MVPLKRCGLSSSLIGFEITESTSATRRPCARVFVETATLMYMIAFLFDQIGAA